MFLIWLRSDPWWISSTKTQFQFKTISFSTIIVIFDKKNHIFLGSQNVEKIDNWKSIEEIIYGDKFNRKCLIEMLWHLLVWRSHFGDPINLKKTSLSLNLSRQDASFINYLAVFWVTMYLAKKVGKSSKLKIFVTIVLIIHSMLY